MATDKHLLWFSPFGPNSDIGAFSRPILHALERNLAAPFTNLELVIEPNGPTYRPPVPFRWIDDLPPLDEALCVFNVGNDKNSHRKINELAMRRAGLVVLHDVVLHDYMVWHYLQQTQDRVSYAAEVAIEGGPEAALRLIEDFVPVANRPPGRAWEKEPLRSLPMLSAVLAHARGVVVHSHFAATVARRYTQAPICELFLSADQKRIYSDKDREQWQARTLVAERVMITSFGNVTRNKRIELICRAFASSPLLKARAVLRIVGHPRDLGHIEELRAFIESEQLGDVVELALGVDDRRLARFKNETDIFVLLRQPNIEGASGSLLEALNTGRPVVAMDSGSFSELPDDACARIAPDDDGTQLQALLEALVEDPQRRIALGAAGHAHQQTRTADLYARSLLDFTRDLGGATVPALAGAYEGALARLVASQPAAFVAELVCSSKMRCPPGSRIALALQRALDPCSLADRLLLTRAFGHLLDHLLTNAPLAVSQSTLSRLAEVVLQFGPTAFVDLFWPQIAASDPDLTRHDAILGFSASGPARWPATLPPRPSTEAACEWMDIGETNRFETTSARAWSAQWLSSWHRPEASGTWTNGRYAIVPLACPHPAAKHGYTLSMAINNVSGSLRDQTTASVDGRIRSVRVRRQDKLRIVEIPLPPNPDAGGWLVVVDIGEAVRPSDRNASRDARLLGAKVSWLSLDPLPVETGVPVPALSTVD